MREGAALRFRYQPEMCDRAVRVRKSFRGIAGAEAAAPGRGYLSSPETEVRLAFYAGRICSQEGP